jgi:SAM-dependent methyltransferase
MLPGYPSTTDAREPVTQGSISDPLHRVGCWLCDGGYKFVTVTPSTHARALRRACRNTAESLEDIFGWNLPFHPRSLPRDVLRLLKNADALTRIESGLLLSRVRFSTLENSLYLHSGYPTVAADAVFFGPDTYRFVALIKRTLPLLRHRIQRVADIGCGTGAGGIVASALLRDSAPQLLLADINPLALQCAKINVQLARTPKVSLLCGDLFAPVTGLLDLIVANPPYLLDSQERVYRHGGGKFGLELSVRILREGLTRLAPGGGLILYTASPIIDGRDLLREEAATMHDCAELSCVYEEIDPDVFGEELDSPAYKHVERIAAVSLLVVRKAGSGGLRRL